MPESSLSARLDGERLARAMAEEFATSLPTDKAGWIEAARNIVERIEGEVE
jgi:hypothetical protein